MSSAPFDTVPPGYTHSKRQTARMSTGGRAPKFTPKLVDLEAEEDNEPEEEEEGEEGYEGSFINDGDDDEEQPIVLSRTPSPVAPSKTGTKNRVKKNERGTTPPLTTRSRAAKVEADSQLSDSPQSDETMPSPVTPQKKSLATNKHSLFMMTYMYISAFLQFMARSGTNDSKPKAVGRKSVSKARYDNPYRLVMSIWLGIMRLTTNGDDTPSPPPRKVGTKTSRKTNLSVSDDNQVDQTRGRGNNTRLVKGTVDSKTGNSIPDEQGGALDVDSEVEAVPQNIAAAFKAMVPEIAPASGSKGNKNGGKKIKQTPVLQTEKTKTVTRLPGKCGVTSLELQDPLLKKQYTGLPKLFKGMVDSWNDAEGNGQVLFSQWATLTPSAKIEILWSWINFVKKDHYINLSHVDPTGLQAVAQLYGTNNKRWTLCVKGKTAVCVSIVMSVKSSLQEPGCTSKDTPKSLRLKFVTGIFHAQEFERFVGVICMVFKQKILRAQMYKSAFTFGTKGFTPEQQATTVPTGSRGVPSPAAKKSSSRTLASDDSLHWTDEIPVYDGRTTEIDLKENIDNIDKLLPRFNDFDGEVPNGSCIAVAYTVSQFLNHDSKESVQLNIRFVVVLGTPSLSDNDSDNMDEEAGDATDAASDS
ncbi:hypothetical protein DFH07DRAFT_955302 [Mycena maculata]|uniref:Uncharacterized protein n=1 Tax=Mycena maculata TaxID=230809 RepID=A0AAD7JKP4_9AGAR|nr:hypothetical protein DFH07DRAFT_955302 [Mycena maculata]